MRVTSIPWTETNLTLESHKCLLYEKNVYKMFLKSNIDFFNNLKQTCQKNHEKLTEKSIER